MFLGIEIGGTKLQIGLGRGDGTLAALWRGGVEVWRGGEGIREQILQETPALLDRAGVSRAEVRGIGVGFGGPVDDADQTVIKSHQIEGWDNFPLAQWLSDLLGWPVALGNDADVAGLAEALFGAGKGLSPIFYITIGSGIGGGLIISGEIYRGCGRGAAEIGHVDVYGSHVTASGVGLPTCGILERTASGWGIAHSAEEELWRNKPRHSPLWQMVNGETQLITSELVGLAAAKGDEVALRLVRGATHSLATVICNMVALLCPRRIIIGGGVALMGEELLFKPMRQLVAEAVFKPFAKCYDIVPAALGEEVVVHWALALARKRFVE
jgi:glucokinase